MKFCPKCEVKLKKSISGLQCSKCGYTEGEKVKPTKNDDVNYKATSVFSSVQDEFEAIAGIVAETDSWKEV